MCWGTEVGIEVSRSKRKQSWVRKDYFQLVQGRKSSLATATKTASLRFGMFGRCIITAKRFGLAGGRAMPKATCLPEVMKQTCFCETLHLHTDTITTEVTEGCVFSFQLFNGTVIRFCKT